MLTRRRLALGALALLVAGFVTSGVLLRSPNAAVIEGLVPASERKRAPELEGDWLVGPPTPLASLRGTPVLINVWASWCPPCRKEAPDLARFDREQRSRARLVGIDYRDTESEGRAFVREFGWRFPIVQDRRGTLVERFQPAGLPTTYLIDRQGRIARRLTGKQTYDSLVEALEALR